MKTNIVRAIVFTLVSTGLAASAVASRTTSTHKISPKTINQVPIPMCGPNDPTACGMD